MGILSDLFSEEPDKNGMGTLYGIVVPLFGGINATGSNEDGPSSGSP